MHPQFALNFSWAVNLLLFGAKGYVWWLSASKAVLASLIDSLVDLASQGVVAMTEIQSKVGSSSRETEGL
eukprot:1160387-Pelagomonas_calceolata.AAC.12